MKAFLDTHAVVALRERDPSVFGAGALDLIERATLFYSPAVRLELRFLERASRVSIGPAAILDPLYRELGVEESQDPFGRVVSEAIRIEWTRDPFDLLIVATAALHRSPLITKDAVIQRHFAEAVW